MLLYAYIVWFKYRKSDFDCMAMRKLRFQFHVKFISIREYTQYWNGRNRRIDYKENRYIEDITRRREDIWLEFTVNLHMKISVEFTVDAGIHFWQEQLVILYSMCWTLTQSSLEICSRLSDCCPAAMGSSTSFMQELYMYTFSEISDLILYRKVNTCTLMLMHFT
jgi:hypothetical protein